MSCIAPGVTGDSTPLVHWSLIWSTISSSNFHKRSVIFVLLSWLSELSQNKIDCSSLVQECLWAILLGIIHWANSYSLGWTHAALEAIRLHRDHRWNMGYFHSFPRGYTPFMAQVPHKPESSQPGYFSLDAYGNTPYLSMCYLNSDRPTAI